MTCGLVKPRVARGSYLWTLVGGIPTNGAWLGISFGSPRVNGCTDSVWPLPLPLNNITIPFLKQHEGYFATDLGVWNRGRLLSWCPLPKLPHSGGRLNDSARSGAPHTAESDFEPGTIRPRSRELITRPPRPATAIGMQ
ncbi:hypothetical protein AVEN_26083-1 [Araneus ventricosus]|uniref:Uncharacterized protein n=1 Tax=Araneus ventricosus TaxID=182803 RepID=A0A4Y2M608_ARAVE|nr:hypothetical protein AVEN_26083-1 [Araneus ventricosus]